MPFGPLLAALGVAAIKSEVRATARRVGRRVALGAVTALLMLLAFGFALAAFAVWLSGEVGAVVALIIVAAGALVLALIIRGVAMLADRQRPYRPATAPPLAETLAGEGAGEEPPAGSAMGSMAVVALVGFILAQRLIKR